MNCFYISRPSKVARDFIVDVLENFWKSQSQQFAQQIQTLVINQDNAAENHSRRTVSMQRIREFSQKLKLNVRLAYYPPDRSKYNPVEKTLGIL